MQRSLQGLFCHYYLRYSSDDLCFDEYNLTEITGGALGVVGIPSMTYTIYKRNDTKKC